MVLSKRISLEETRKDSGIEFTENPIVRKEQTLSAALLPRYLAVHHAPVEVVARFHSLDTLRNLPEHSGAIIEKPAPAPCVESVRSDQQRESGFMRKLFDVHQWWRHANGPHVTKLMTPPASNHQNYLMSLAHWKNNSDEQKQSYAGAFPPTAHKSAEIHPVGHGASQKFSEKASSWVRHMLHHNHGADKEQVEDLFLQNPVDGTQLCMKRRCTSETILRRNCTVIKGHVLGKGANSTVRVVEYVLPDGSKGLFAVKEFRDRAKTESVQHYISKICNEFCIAHSLDHTSIIQTVDFFQSASCKYSQMMEYCSGGDLCAVLQQGPLTWGDTVCYFAQLMSGTMYIHSKGVVHRDLKPENLLIDGNGLLKISDFGEAEIIQSQGSPTKRHCRAICGSAPYIAPEEYTEKEFDGPPLDVWSCGIIFLVMLYSRIPWCEATPNDPNYSYFSSHRLGKFQMIDKLPCRSRNLINGILEPDPKKRLCDDDIKKNEWFANLLACTNLMLKATPTTPERRSAETFKRLIDPFSSLLQPVHS